MLEKITSVVSLFRLGQSVDNPDAWKKGAITVTVLAPVLLAANQVAKAYGYDIGLTDDQATEVAGGIIAVVNIVVHLISSKTLGVLPPAKS